MYLKTIVFVFLPGACADEMMNILSLRNGSSTTDQPAFVSDWTLAENDGVCLPKRRIMCTSGASMGCQALRLEAFEQCHAHIPVQVFLAKCEERACEEADVCEILSAYARLCRQSGVCVNWRSPHLCRKSFTDICLADLPLMPHSHTYAPLQHCSAPRPWSMMPVAQGV